MNWSQELVYHPHRYRFSVPFSFPSYVNPRKKQKKETIKLSVSSGTGAGVLCGNASHPLKVCSASSPRGWKPLPRNHVPFNHGFLFQEVCRDASKVDFVYEGDVSTWSDKDFTLTYSVRSFLGVDIGLRDWFYRIRSRIEPNFD